MAQLNALKSLRGSLTLFIPKWPGAAPVRAGRAAECLPPSARGAVRAAEAAGGGVPALFRVVDREAGGRRVERAAGGRPRSTPRTGRALARGRQGVGYRVFVFWPTRARPEIAALAVADR